MDGDVPPTQNRAPQRLQGVPGGAGLNPEDTELAAVIAVPLVGPLLLQSFSPEKPGDPLQSTTPPPDRKGGVLDCQQPPVSTVHMGITMILQF